MAGNAQGDHGADRQQDSRQQEGQARHVDARGWRNRKREHLREQERAEDAGKARQAADRALQPALLGRVDLVRHQRLDRRLRETPQRHQRDAEQEHRAGVGHAHHQERADAAQHAAQHQPAFAELRRQLAGKHGLHEAVAGAHQHQHVAHRLRAPAIAIVRIEHEGGLQHVMREVHQKHHHREAHHQRIAPQQLERTQRMRTVHFKMLRALFLRQGLGQHEQAVQEIARGQPARHPERQAQMDIAQKAAQARSDDEAEPERAAEDAVGRGTLLLRRDVGDVGIGGGEARRRHAQHHARDEQQPQGGRQREHDEIDGQAGVGDEDDRPPPEAVRQRALHRRERELHDGKHRAEHAHPPGRPGDAAAGKLFDQMRQHRNHDAERKHVQHHGDEDERDRGAAARMEFVDGRLVHGAGLAVKSAR